MINGNLKARFSGEVVRFGKNLGVFHGYDADKDYYAVVFIRAEYILVDGTTLEDVPEEEASAYRLYLERSPNFMRFYKGCIVNGDTVKASEERLDQVYGKRVFI